MSEPPWRRAGKIWKERGRCRGESVQRGSESGVERAWEETAGRGSVAVGSVCVAVCVRLQGATRERAKYLLHQCGTGGKGRT